MEDSLRTGFSFGLTSAVITTLGLMIGLNSGIGTKIAVVGGILTIAIADAFSDAFGVHISEESENAHTPMQVWKSTFFTFITKLVFALTFVIPVLLLPLGKAMIASVLYGLALLSIFSYFMARKQNENPLKVILEHLTIAITVVIITNYVGEIIKAVFA
ncbi:MAG: hypothetical protein NTV63_05780 [Candidatus Woesearchaeota archaeon]|nr:hypothetical protein [Candidatus Woesearchaeota archaeon]